MKSAALPTCFPSAADSNQATKPKTGWPRSAKFASATTSRAHSARSLAPPGGRPRPPASGGNVYESPLIKKSAVDEVLGPLCALQRLFFAYSAGKKLWTAAE